MLAAGLLWAGCTAYAQQAPVFHMEYTNAKLMPSHWILKLSPDGNGWFDAEGGAPQPESKGKIEAGPVHRAVQLSPELTERVFKTAREKKLFQINCESHMKVAFQGTKRFTYTGPEGTGSCEYNYSKDKDIQNLGDALLEVETTLMFGARLEKLLQHDRLGLDWELQSLADAIHGGNALELETIHETLARIADDEMVLDRARKKARVLLAGKAGDKD